MRAGRDRERESIGQTWRVMDTTEDSSRVKTWEEVIGWCKAVSNSCTVKRRKRSSTHERTRRLDI